MKKKILLLMGVFSLGLLQAQVGVNTANPLGVLHIDAAGNNSSVPTVAELQDDVIFTSDGKLGLGMAPSASDPSPVQIKGAVFVNYNNPKLGQVFTAYGSGLGRWAAPEIYQQIAGSTSVAAGVVLSSLTANDTYFQTGIFVNIAAKTKSAVNVSLILKCSPALPSASSIQVACSFSDDPSTTAFTPNLGGLLGDPPSGNPIRITTTVDGSSAFAILSGTLFLTNSTNGVKTYYLVAAIRNKNYILPGTSATHSDTFPTPISITVGDKADVAYNSITVFKVRDL